MTTMTIASNYKSRYSDSAALSGHRFCVLAEVPRSLRCVGHPRRFKMLTCGLTNRRLQRRRQSIWPIGFVTTKVEARESAGSAHNWHTLDHQRDQYSAPSGSISVGVPLIKQINAVADGREVLEHIFRKPQ
jgi:hypothetical protein